MRLTPPAIVAGALAAALLLGLGEAWLAARAGRTLQDAILYGLAAGAATLWVVAVIQLIASRSLGPSRQQIAGLARGAEQHEHFARIAWERLLKLQRATRLLLAERRLPDIEARISAAEAAMEAPARRTEAFAAWRDLADEWMRCVGPLVPEIEDDIVPADAAAMRATRRKLPAAQNLSSADLKATVMYVIERQQLDRARSRFAAFRDAAMQEHGFS